MKKHLAITSILLFCFIVTASSQKRATLVFDSLQYHLNTVNLGEPSNLLKEFIFTNTGEAPLIIKSLHTSTEDVTVECKNKTISPKGKGKITIKFNPETEHRGNMNIKLVVSSNAEKSLDTIHISSNIIYSIKGALIQPIK